MLMGILSFYSVLILLVTKFLLISLKKHHFIEIEVISVLLILPMDQQKLSMIDQQYLNLLAAITSSDLPRSKIQNRY